MEIMEIIQSIIIIICLIINIINLHFIFEKKKKYYVIVDIDEDKLKEKITEIMQEFDKEN